MMTSYCLRSRNAASIAVMALFWLAIAQGSVAAVGAGLAAAAEVLPVEGPPFAAGLNSIDAGWQIEFSGEMPRRLPAEDLVAWGAFADAAHGSQILLAGGGLLVADVVGLDKEVLRCEGDALGQSKLPLESVQGVLWHPPADRPRRDRLAQRVRSAAGDQDRLILDNGDELSGTVAGLREDVLQFESAGATTEIATSRLAAVVFNPALAARPRSAGLRAMVGFADGSQLLASKLLVRNGQAQLQSAGLGEVKFPSEKITALQPFGGKAVYLSDLSPASYKFIPLLRLNWPYHADANVMGGALRAGGHLYLKGLGVHSALRLTYDLDQSYRRLQAELAVDDQTQSRGSVEFRVFVDSGNGQWQAKFASAIQRGGQAPTAMSVDIGNARRISLLVEFADHGDELDHADWLNARLIK